MVMATTNQKPNRLKYSKDRVLSALKRTRGNVTEAAELLGASLATMNRYIKRYGIDVDGIGAQLDLEAIRASMERNYGNLRVVAFETQISRPTIYKYMREYPELEAYRVECERMLIERAEQGLVKHIREDNLKAITFLLRTKGGYRTSGDVTVKGDPNEPIKTVIEVVYVKKQAGADDE